MAGGDPGPSTTGDRGYTLGPVESELVATKLKLARLLRFAGREAEATAELEDALRLDPENLVIRKQIWALRYPERFHPEIDWDWQKGQLRKERQQEVAAGICGPDGCPIR